MASKLYKSRTDRKISGVCGGLAEYFDKDPTMIRLIVFLAAVFTEGIVLIAYIVAAIVLPDAPKEFKETFDKASAQNVAQEDIVEEETIINKDEAVDVDVVEEKEDDLHE